MTREEYQSNPKVCLVCSKPVPFEKRRNKFCGHSCSASYTNTGRRHTESTKRKISASRPKIYPFSKVYFITCKGCQATISNRSCRQVYCSTCKKIDKVRYKRESSFRLNKRDHPELFDSELISEYGWFVSSGPKKNRKGVSWDHLYPLHLGFENAVEPSIMRHPANAELVPHDENLRRYHRERSMISYEDLIDRIRRWDSGDRTLEKFYSKKNPSQ